MNSLRIQSPQDDHPELDLRALLQAIFRSKRSIAILTLLGTLISSAHTLLTPSHYQTQSILRPATVKDLDALNSTGLYALTPEEALKRVGATLESWDSRRAFVENWSGSKTPAERHSVEQALEDISILRPDARQGEQFSDSVSIRLTYPEGLDGAGLVNGLVAHAIKSEQQRIVLEVKALAKNRQIQLEKKISAARASHEARKQAHIAALREADNLRKVQLQDELRALRMQLKKRREDHIAQLAEAIRIAEKLEIHTPSTRSTLAPNPTAGQTASVVYTEINNQATPLYFLGTRALQAERNALLERSSDDFAEPRIAEIMSRLQLLEHNREIELLQSRTDEEPFMKDLASWREEAARLQQLETDLNDLRLAIVDQPALKPEKPIGPGKASDILSGTIAGAALGVLLALLRAVFMPGQKRGPE